ncbi:MAG TPA: serine hydrolase [Gemmatimonadaceae bacterium]|nr:serine hydrolase [Gemmatimonadaceae bacterium]
MSLRASILWAFAAVHLACPTLDAQAPAPPPGFDAYVQRVLETFDVPGAGVAIVKDGRVVLAKGYGVRKLGQPGRVDANTRFGIASNTKLFTATAIAMLVEQGKLEWDAPVVRYLPDFAMYDPFVTRELTVRDLLVHRSGLGLGAGDLLWWPASTYDRAEIARRLRFIKPATSFRSAYAYDNVLYLVAGQLIEKLSGVSWEEFVRTRIVAPVGMASSTVRHADAASGASGSSGANVAATHAEVNGVVRPIAPMTSDNTNPAGGINSSAADMARWMIVQMDSGRIASAAGGAPEKRLFAPASTRELWSIVTPIRVGARVVRGFEHLRPNLSGYALGLFVSDYRGHLRLVHSGGLPGYLSLVTMIPGEKLGVAVLTNQESGDAFNVITQTAIDAYLNVPRLDYLAYYAARRDTARMDLARSAQRAAAARDSTSGPSLALAKYAGRYTDAWYGDVDIAQEGAGLVMRFGHTPQLVGDMVHWQHDSFLVRWRDRELRADAYATFALNPDGSIDQLKMAPASDDVDFSFDFQDLLLRPAAKAQAP